MPYRQKSPKYYTQCVLVPTAKHLDGRVVQATASRLAVMMFPTAKVPGDRLLDPTAMDSRSSKISNFFQTRVKSRISFRKGSKHENLLQGEGGQYLRPLPMC